MKLPIVHLPDMMQNWKQHGQKLNRKRKNDSARQNQKES